MLDAKLIDVMYINVLQIVIVLKFKVFENVSLLIVAVLQVNT